MAGLKSFSIRGLLNRAISARVDAQLDWHMSGVEETLATLQRLTTEMSTTIATRLAALEAAALAERSDAKKASTPDAS